MKNIGCKTRIKIRRADVSHMYHFQNTYDLRGERLFPIEFVASQSDWIWKWLAEIRWVGCFTPEKGRGKNLVPFHILLIVFSCHIWVYFTMCEAMFAFCGLLWVFLHGGIFCGFWIVCFMDVIEKTSAQFTFFGSFVSGQGFIASFSGGG